MSRQFEKNDFVIHNNGSKGVVNEVRNTSVLILCFATNEENFILKDNIKTIRKPRKGNAESRAIVAMLARESRCKISRSLHIQATELYKKAKLMLK